MLEVICDASPIQYLHQAGLLDLLRLRYGVITIPTAVATELHEGMLRRVDLPDLGALAWMRIRQPESRLLVPIVADLGVGEREGVEIRESVKMTGVVVEGPLPDLLRWRASPQGKTQMRDSDHRPQPHPSDGGAS